MSPPITSSESSTAVSPDLGGLGMSRTGAEDRDVRIVPRAVRKAESVLRDGKEKADD